MSSPYQAPAETSNLPNAPMMQPGATRPTGVTVFAILNIIFGLMGVFGIVVSVGMLVLGSRIAGPNPVMDKMFDSVAYLAFTAVGMVVGIVFSILLLFSGIGLLKMSKSARTISIVYGVYAIVSTILANAVNVFVVFIPALEQAQGAQRAGMIGGIIGAGIGGLVGLIYPIALLIYFTRPTVKHYFESWPRSDSD